MQIIARMLVRLLVLFVCLSSFSALAAPPTVVDWVYRISLSSPDKVFAEGFVPWGNVYDFFEHAAGTTFLDHTTGFVSTTSITTNYVPLADYLGRLWAGANSRFWVYRIRANQDTYDWIATMEDAIARATAAGNRAGIEELRQTLTAFRHQQEYLNRGAITPDRIHSAQQIIASSSPAGVLGELRLNAGYNQSLDTRSASQSYVAYYPDSIANFAPVPALGFTTSNDTSTSRNISVGMACAVGQADAADNTNGCNIRAATRVPANRTWTCSIS